MSSQILMWRKIILEEKKLEKMLEEARKKAEETLKEARKKAEEIKNPERIKKIIEEILEKEKLKIIEEAKKKEKMKEELLNILEKIDYSEFSDIIKKIVEEVLKIDLS